MATTMLVLIVVLLTMTVIPWIEKRDRTEMHHTDLMAGDE